MIWTLVEWETRIAHTALKMFFTKSKLFSFLLSRSYSFRYHEKNEKFLFEYHEKMFFPHLFVIFEKKLSRRKTKSLYEHENTGEFIFLGRSIYEKKIFSDLVQKDSIHGSQNKGEFIPFG